MQVLITGINCAKQSHRAILSKVMRLLRHFVPRNDMANDFLRIHQPLDLNFQKIPPNPPFRKGGNRSCDPSKGGHLRRLQLKRGARAWKWSSMLPLKIAIRCCIIVATCCKRSIFVAHLPRGKCVSFRIHIKRAV